MDKFNFDERNWHVDGSETWEEYTDRFLGGLNDICAAQEGKTIAVFSHACVLRGMQKKLLKTDELPFCENTAVSRLRWEDGAVTFELLNDASHLTPEISTAIRQQRLKQGATDRADFSLWFEKAADTHETYLAKLRDKTVGRLMLGSGNTTDTGVILDLSLDEPHRGRRFGQQLLGQAVCTERRRGAKRPWRPSGPESWRRRCARSSARRACCPTSARTWRGWAAENVRKCGSMWIWWALGWTARAARWKPWSSAGRAEYGEQ